MAKKREIGIVLEVDDKGTTKLIKFSENAKKSFKKTSDSATGLTSTLTKLTGVLGGLAIAAGAVGMARFIKENLEAADSIGKVADKVGVTTDQLQELRFAAEQNGVAIRTTDMALQRFGRRHGEVANMTGELLNMYKKYNIQLTDSEGRMRSNMELLEDWAEVVKNAGTEQEALLINFKLFDSEGAAMKNLLRHGADGMNRLRQEAHDLGIVLDEDLIRGAEKANDELGKLSRVIEAQFMGAIAEMAPEIATMAGDLIETLKDQEFRTALKEILGTFASLLVVTVKTIGALNEFFSRSLPATIEATRAEIGTIEKQIEAIYADAGDDTPVGTILALERRLGALKEQLAVLEGVGKQSFNSISSAGKKLGAVLGKVADEDAKKLEKAMDSLYEQIQAHDETTLETQLRHLDELAAEWSKNADMIRLIEHRKYQLISKMANDLASEVERLLEEERAKAEELGQAEVDRRDKTGRETVKLNKSSLQQMLEDWADYSKGWDQIAKDFLTGIQSSLFDAFRGAFENVNDAWDSLWEGMKNIAYQVLAAIATKMASGLVANIVLNVMGSGGGGSVVSAMLNGGGGGFGNYMPNMNILSGARNWVGMGGLGSGAANMVNGYSGSLYAFNEGAGMAGNAMNAGTSGMGMMGTFAGYAGAALAAYGLYDLYTNGPGGVAGAGQGMMTGAMGGAALGSVVPGIGTMAGLIVGAIVGALAGGLGGGGDDEAAARMEDAQAFADLAEKFKENEGTQKDYMEAIKSAHRSDNRVGPQAMWQLYALAKAQGKLDWWAPDPGQLGTETWQRKDWTDEQWKRFQVYGGADPTQTGAMDFAQLFGGGGKGAWGGADWSQVQDVMEGLSEETIDRLGSSLGTIKDLATEWGLSVADLLGPLNDADLNSDEWKEALEGLTAATLVQNAADAERAKGLSELEVINNKVMRSIKLLAGWNDMEADGKSEMIDMLRQDASRREELMNAAERLKEIEDKLLGAHKLSKEEVEALAEEYAALTEMLGLNDSASANAADAAEKFAKVMTEQVIPAIEEALRLGNGDQPPENHYGGLIFHGGGFVDSMLRAGMITMHGGGLKQDERLAILQSGEYVVRRSSVNPDTMAILQQINRTGRPPADVWTGGSLYGQLAELVMGRTGQVMDRMRPAGQYHDGGPVGGSTAPAAAAPRGGDSGPPVQIINHIHAAPGMDEQALAREVVRQTMAQLKKSFPQLVINNRELLQRVVQQTLRIRH